MFISEIYLYQAGFTLLTIVFIFAFSNFQILLNPVLGFFVLNWISGFGVMNMLDLESEVDEYHLMILFLSLISYAMGVFLVFFSCHNIRKTERIFYNASSYKNETIYTDITIWGLVLFSVIVCVLYYQAIGYNLLTSSITNYMNNLEGFDDLAGKRLATYAGEKYFYPGYVNQFKNIILPALLIYLFVGKKWKLSKFMALLLAPLTVIFLMGTGQRYFIVLALVLSFLFLHTVHGQRVKYTQVILFIVLAMIAFNVGSMVIGRHGDDTILQKISHRLMNSNQLSSVVGFRYVFDIGITYGKEFLTNILGVLPGIKGSTLGHEIHYELFSSWRGNAPLSIWGQFWYNFGILGVVIIAAMLGAIHAWVYIKLISGSKNIFRILTYTIVIITLATWSSGSIVYLLLNGLPTAFILYVLYRVSLSQGQKKIQFI